MAESLCQKRALEAFQLDPAKWGGEHIIASTCPEIVSNSHAIPSLITIILHEMCEQLGF